MKGFFLFVFICFSYAASAQDTTHYYLDSLASKLSGQENATFHFKVYKDANRWCVDKLIISANYLMEKVHYKDKGLTVLDGAYTYYRENGKPAEQGDYINGQQNGWWTVHNTSGVLTDSILYKLGEKFESFVFRAGVLKESMKKEKSLIHNIVYYDNAVIKKDVVMKDGGGISYVLEYDENGRLLQRSEPENGRLQVTAYYDSTGRKVKVKPYSPPEYPTGITGLQKFIDTQVKLPNRHRLYQYYPCTFMAILTINADGEVTDVKVVKSVNVDFDNIVSNALKRMPAWTMHGAKEYKFPLSILFKD